MDVLHRSLRYYLKHPQLLLMYEVVWAHNQQSLSSLFKKECHCSMASVTFRSTFSHLNKVSGKLEHGRIRTYHTKHYYDT